MYASQNKCLIYSRSQWGCLLYRAVASVSISPALHPFIVCPVCGRVLDVGCVENLLQMPFESEPLQNSEVLFCTLNFYRESGSHHGNVRLPLRHTLVTVTLELILDLKKRFYTHSYKIVPSRRAFISSVAIERDPAERMNGLGWVFYALLLYLK